ncbi:replicative DNA helicase [Deinococcus yunweiensis]|uniref:replicative DNA helicase n=1 Tax=Deinococcus yunweiensis TaxID=367282 RepID=UPI00398EE547
MTAPRPLPGNIGLEEKTLATVFVDSTFWPELAALPDGAWTAPATRALRDVLMSLHTSGRPLDDHGLVLQRAAELGASTFVNLAYLNALQGMADLTAYYAPHYVAELRHLHARRELIRGSHRVIHHASEGDLTPEELATLASQLGGVVDDRKRTGFITHAQAIDEALAVVESSSPSAISTGFHDLDAALVGLEPGALYVLAARPAMGKTAMGYAFILNAAKKGYHCAVASLEMPASQLTLRALATAASVDLSRIRQRTTSGPERERLRLHAGRTRGLPIHYLEASDQTAASLARDARKLHAAGELDLLMIDYLQLIESGKGGNENRVQEVSQISRTLKKLAMELQIPVVVLSQLSRAVEMRPNHRPMLSDLRESGAIEQDADTVLFIYRDEYYNKETDQQGIAEVIVGKQRNGPVGTIKLSYSSEFVRFGSLTQAAAPLL